jgi:hypothetical protein
MSKYLDETGLAYLWTKLKAYITAANTTYTFTGGTNSFKVTPSGGTQQTVSVTPKLNGVTWGDLKGGNS